MKIKKHIIIIFLTCFVLLTKIYISFNHNHVIKAKAAPNVTKNEKVIYLTFDDGPSSISDKILDILKEKNVNATFFLIGNQIKDNESTVKRIHDEGNSIGLHTYTHKTQKIYSSQDNFIKEMNSTQEEVYRVVGIRPNIIRFPTGSKNHLNKNMLEKLHKCNYKIYDWNAVISDGINVNTPSEKLFKQATGRKNKPNSIILLMHCNYMNKNTCKALPKIIDYYKQEGYKFKVITNDTPELYSPIS